MTDTTTPDQGDERRAFVQWLGNTFPHSYDEKDAEHYWQHGHVSALAWQAARALSAAQPVAQEAIDLGGTRLTEYDARTIRILLGKHHQMMITLPPNDVDRLKQLLAGAALAQEAIGTFNCPICGNGTPHHHSDFEQVQAMSEEQIDAELRALGIDPDKAAQKVKAVIDHCWAEYDRRLKNPIATPHHPVSAEAGKGATDDSAAVEWVSKWMGDFDVVLPNKAFKLLIRKVSSSQQREPQEAAERPANFTELWELYSRVGDAHENHGRNHEKTMEARATFHAALMRALSAPQEAGKPAACTTIADCTTPKLCLSVGTCKGYYVMPASVRESAAPVEEAGKVEPVADEPIAWQERTYWDDGAHDEPGWGAWRECRKPTDEQLQRAKNLGIKREYRPVYLRPTQQALSADMFWDYDDGERYGNDIDEIVADYGPGEIVKIDCAKRLPSIKVRVIVDPSDPDALTYEEIPAILAAAGDSEK